MDREITIDVPTKIIINENECGVWCPKRKTIVGISSPWYTCSAFNHCRLLNSKEEGFTLRCKRCIQSMIIVQMEKRCDRRSGVDRRKG